MLILPWSVPGSYLSQPIPLSVSDCHGIVKTLVCGMKTITWGAGSCKIPGTTADFCKLEVWMRSSYVHVHVHVLRHPGCMDRLQMVCHVRCVCLAYLHTQAFPCCVLSADVKKKMHTCSKHNTGRPGYKASPYHSYILVFVMFVAEKLEKCLSTCMY